jgi:hypothetical protein
MKRVSVFEIGRDILNYAASTADLGSNHLYVSWVMGTALLMLEPLLSQVMYANRTNARGQNAWRFLSTQSKAVVIK